MECKNVFHFCKSQADLYIIFPMSLYYRFRLLSKYPNTLRKFTELLVRGIVFSNRPLSRRLDRCDRMIQNESRHPNGGNAYYVTMQITFLTRKFRNVERNLHCDVVHITTVWVSSLTLDCNGVYAIRAYCITRHKPTSSETRASI